MPIGLFAWNGVDIIIITHNCDGWFYRRKKIISFLIFQFRGGETRVRYGTVGQSSTSFIIKTFLHASTDCILFSWFSTTSVSSMSISFFASNGRRFNRFRMCCGTGTRLCIVSFVLIEMPKEVQITWLTSDERCSNYVQLVCVLRLENIILNQNLRCPCVQFRETDTFKVYVHRTSQITCLNYWAVWFVHSLCTQSTLTHTYHLLSFKLFAFYSFKRRRSQ